MNGLARSLWLAFALAACSAPSPLPTTYPWSTLQHRTLTVGDRERNWLLLVPAACRDRRELPLVLVLHRRGGDAEQAARDYGFRELAEREGVVVAWPEAKTPWAWSAGGLPLGDAAADLAFLDQLLDTLVQELPIDAHRIWCCGHSSGGIMAYDFAAHAAHRLAAIGVVAGTIGGRGQHGREVPPGEAVAVMHIHGTADEQIPYDHEHTRPGSFDFFVSAPDSVAAWAARNGCAPARDEALTAEHRVTRFPDGRDGSEVVLHTLANGRHAWPRRDRGDALDATEVLWRFFRAHTR